MNKDKSVAIIDGNSLCRFAITSVRQCPGTPHGKGSTVFGRQRWCRTWLLNYPRATSPSHEFTWAAFTKSMSALLKRTASANLKMPAEIQAVESPSQRTRLLHQVS